MIIAILIIGLILRIIVTIFWAAEDEWPTKTIAKKFYFIPFYWCYMVFKWINSQVKDE